MVAVVAVGQLDDHLPCPALPRWLPAEVEGGVVASFIAAPTKGWTPRRALRRFVARWPAVGDDDRLDALLVVAPLDVGTAAIPTDTLERVRPGGRVIDLATARRGGWLGLRPQPQRDTAAQRLRSWLERGLVDVEQWIALDPPDVVVTMGIRRAPP